MDGGRPGSFSPEVNLVFARPSGLATPLAARAADLVYAARRTRPLETDAAQALVGTLAGKYRIVRLIGRGGMGTVYEAQNERIGKRVALKFVLVDRANDPSALSRFHREAQAVSALSSQHIVQVFDTGETDGGEPFLVMELLQGEDLATRLARSKRLTAADAVRFAVETLRGLRHAHGAGIVHRDLKPHNLYLVRGDDDLDHVKIVDFGLSKVVGLPVGASLTQQGATVGTPLYMSPEQVEGQPDVDHRADLWSMGAILFETLAGRPPFPESTYARLVLAICQRDAPDVRDLVSDVAENVATAVRRALQRDRAGRFQSADEFLAALGVSATMRAPVPEPMPSDPAAVSGNRVTNPDARAGAPSAGGGAVESSDAALSSSGREPPGAELRTYTAGGATVWLSQTPAFSLWRGEVAAPDRLRVEARDGAVHELRLSPVGPLKLGRTERVGEEKNDLVYPDVASRLAATLRHDGVRWWIRRREECSVPVQVGARALARSEEAPMVHGTFVSVGGMRATFVDRRYVTPVVTAGAVDPVTGLLGRVGLEQELAAYMSRQRPGGLVLVRERTRGEPIAPPASRAVDVPPLVAAALAVHRAHPSDVVGHADGTVVLLVAGEAQDLAETARRVEKAARGAGLAEVGVGYWPLAGDAPEAGREIELAMHAIAALPEGAALPAALRDVSKPARFATSTEMLTASRDGKRTTLLFAIEEQNALGGVGPHVVGALEQELAAVVSSHAGQGAVVAPLATGVVGAVVTRKVDPGAIGNAVLCDWHARPPVMDGKVELPRSLSWEVLHGTEANARAADLARECSDPHGVLSALSGGLPYPIAGRVNAAIAASSAIERVKVLFDVLEGIWRFIATVLASAWFAKRPAPGEKPPGFDAMLDLARRVGTRDGLSLGTWRELARAAGKGFEDKSDPIGALARDVLNVKLSANQTFETLSNLMQVERNGFAHGHYNEARATADLPEFEQMTRTLLRALRPLGAWTLVTVEKTEPDLYGEMQTVEFIDHTGPFNTGTRRRIGLNSPVRLANVVYLARWREGLVLPLEPFVRRVASEDRFDLYWMDHLPRAGACSMSAAVSGNGLKVTCDARRLPPLMRTLIESA